MYELNKKRFLSVDLYKNFLSQEVVTMIVVDFMCGVLSIMQNIFLIYR